MNKKFFVLILLCLVLFNSMNVFALGVTPARTTIDFEPNLKRTVSFSIINSEKRDANIVITTQGELKDNIFLSSKEFSISSKEQSKQISYELSLPSSMEPGLHTAEVVILQLPEDIGESDAFIGAALAVVTQVHVYVPYPGKYADADMNIFSGSPGGEVIFILPVISRGAFDLVSVKANVDIYNFAGEKVSSFNTQEIKVLSGERKEIVHKWKSDIPAGNYLAKATLIYDGETKSIEKTFSIGNQYLELQQIEVNDFSLGDIAKMEMLVENKWGEEIKGAYTQTNIFNDKGELMADFKSAGYDISALSKKVLVSYWDTAGVREGIYNTKVFLKYSDKSAQSDLKLDVKTNRIDVIGLGYVISEDSESDGNILMVVLIIGVVILILVNVLWFLLLRKKLKR